MENKLVKNVRAILSGISEESLERAEKNILKLCSVGSQSYWSERELAVRIKFELEHIEEQDLHVAEKEILKEIEIYI